MIPFKYSFHMISPCIVHLLLLHLLLFCWWQFLCKLLGQKHLELLLSSELHQSIPWWQSWVPIALTESCQSCMAPMRERESSIITPMLMRVWLSPSHLLSSQPMHHFPQAYALAFPFIIPVIFIFPPSRSAEYSIPSPHRRKILT